jgi:hypothetical protein
LELADCGGNGATRRLLPPSRPRWYHWQLHGKCNPFGVHMQSQDGHTFTGAHLYLPPAPQAGRKGRDDSCQYWPSFRPPIICMIILGRQLQRIMCIIEYRNPFCGSFIMIPPCLLSWRNHPIERTPRSLLYIMAHSTYREYRNLGPSDSLYHISSSFLRRNYLAADPMGSGVFWCLHPRFLSMRTQVIKVTGNRSSVSMHLLRQERQGFPM